MWLCWHSKIKTNFLLNQRGLDIDLHCLLCPTIEENTNHILRNCTQAIELWNQFCPHLDNPTYKRLFNDSPLKTWLFNNLTTTTTLLINIPWSTLFAFSGWMLWKNRNCRKIWRELPLTPSLHCILSLATEFINITNVVNPKSKENYLIYIKWYPPPQATFHLSQYWRIILLIKQARKIRWSFSRPQG